MNTPSADAQRMSTALIQRLRRQARVSAANLSVDAVYQAPSGRKCRLLAEPHDGSKWRNYFTFVYLDHPGQKHDRGGPLENGDGFSLTAANIHLLREVMR